MKVVVIEELCTKNHFCSVINVCPGHAIKQNSPCSALVIEHENCTDC